MSNEKPGPGIVGVVTTFPVELDNVAQGRDDEHVCARRVGDLGVLGPCLGGCGSAYLTPETRLVAADEPSPFVEFEVFTDPKVFGATHRLRYSDQTEELLRIDGDAVLERL